MSQPTPGGGSQPVARQRSPAAPPAGDVLHETIQQLEEVRTRAGAGEIADRLATVCDRLRSAEAALGRDPAGAVRSENPESPWRAGPGSDRVSSYENPLPPNESERY